MLAAVIVSRVAAQGQCHSDDSNNGNNNSNDGMHSDGRKHGDSGDGDGKGTPP